MYHNVNLRFEISGWASKIKYNYNQSKMKIFHDFYQNYQGSHQQISHFQNHLRQKAAELFFQIIFV